MLDVVPWQIQGWMGCAGERASFWRQCCMRFLVRFPVWPWGAQERSKRWWQKMLLLPDLWRASRCRVQEVWIHHLCTEEVFRMQWSGEKQAGAEGQRHGCRACFWRWWQQHEGHKGEAGQGKVCPKEDRSIWLQLVRFVVPTCERSSTTRPTAEGRVLSWWSDARQSWYGCTGHSWPLEWCWAWNVPEMRGCHTWGTGWKSLKAVVFLDGFYCPGHPWPQQFDVSRVSRHQSLTVDIVVLYPPTRFDMISPVDPAESVLQGLRHRRYIVS